MKTKSVTMVRVYITEGEHQFQRLMALLHDEVQVCGVTAFRGISGFGKSGKVHSSNLLELSLDLPLVLEFFDQPEKVKQVLKQLNELLEPGHVISWPAHVNAGD